MSDLKVYTDGKDTLYEPVILSLRTFLDGIEEIQNSKGGAIIFFTKKHNKKLYVKIFPFKKNLDFFEKIYSSHTDIKKAVIERINMDQPYTDIWHYETFLKENQTDTHLFKKVPPENVLNLSGNCVIVNKESLSWDRFLSDILEGKIESNTYEQLYFAAGCDEVAFIPLPVLSTPSILLVLDSKVIEKNRNTLLQALYFRSRDIISKHLYSRLIDDVTAYLKLAGENISEENLVDKFVNELCKVLLPISYIINDGPEIVYYNSWPQVEDSAYVLELLEGKYKIHFKLTSFYYVDFESVDNNWKFIHHTKIYDANKKQSSFLISKIFNLLHKLWVLVKWADERAQAKLAEKIYSKEIKEFIDTAEKIKDIFQKIKIESTQQSSYFLITDETNDKAISITVNNIKILDTNDLPGNNQRYGFIYIHFILKTAYSNNNGKYQITPDELIKEVGSPRKEKTSGRKPGTGKNDLGEERNEAEDHYVLQQLTIHDLYSDYNVVLTAFFDKWRKEIAQFNKDWEQDLVKPVTEIKFAAAFYFLLRFLLFLQQKRPANYMLPKDLNWDHFNKNVDMLRGLLIIFNKVDKERTEHEIEKIDLTPYFTDLNKKVGRDFYSNTGIVLECYKAAKRVLNRLVSEPGRSQTETQWFYKNLVEGGLALDKSEQPVSRHSYSFDKNKVELPINFIFKVTD